MRSKHRLASVLTLMAFFAMTTGCYTYHSIAASNLASLSDKAERGTVEVENEDGDQIVVQPESAIDVFDNDGLRHRIRPFAFTVTGSQLIDSEQDLVLGLDMIESVQVLELSTVGTLGLVGVGLAGLGTMAGIVVLTAEDTTGF